MTGGIPRNPRDGEDTAVLCWCQRTIVYVDVVEIRKGRTRTCGRRDCGPS